MTHKMASPGADRLPLPPPRYASAFRCCGAHFYCCDEDDFVDRIQLWHRLACDSDCWIIVIFRASKQNNNNNGNNMGRGSVRRTNHDLWRQFKENNTIMGNKTDLNAYAVNGFSTIIFFSDFANKTNSIFVYQQSRRPLNHIFLHPPFPLTILRVL